MSQYSSGFCRSGILCLDYLSYTDQFSIYAKTLFLGRQFLFNISRLRVKVRISVIYLYSRDLVWQLRLSGTPTKVSKSRRGRRCVVLALYWDHWDPSSTLCGLGILFDTCGYLGSQQRNGAYAVEIPPALPWNCLLIVQIYPAVAVIQA